VGLITWEVPSHKRHQVCGGPCGVLVTLEIKEEGSLGLSDRLREGKG
jgi:hypothetical protein